MKLESVAKITVGNLAHIMPPLTFRKSYKKTFSELRSKIDELFKTFTDDRETNSLFFLSNENGHLSIGKNCLMYFFIEY